MGSMNRKQVLLCALAFIIPALVGFFVWSDDGKRSGEDSVVAEITEAETQMKKTVSSYMS